MEKQARLRAKPQTRTLTPWVVASAPARPPERSELLAAVARVVDCPMQSVTLEERVGHVAVLRLVPLRLDPVLPFPYDIRMSPPFWYWYRRYWLALSEYLSGALLPGLNELRMRTLRRRVLCNLDPLTPRERRYFTRWLMASRLGPADVRGF